MRLLVLWAGIVAFVLIGLFPPIAGGHIDMPRLLCDWAVVADRTQKVTPTD
jgi:hypothetical protein